VGGKDEKFKTNFLYKQKNDNFEFYYGSGSGIFWIFPA
jgi:hypothetical protein